MFGDSASFVWQAATTPPPEEVKAIVLKEEEKRRIRQAREKEAEQQREEAADNQRTMIAQEQTAVQETRKSQRLSRPLEQLTPTLTLTTSTPIIPSTEQHSTLHEVAIAEAVVVHQVLQVAEAETEFEQSEKSSSAWSTRTLLSAGVSAALVVALGAVLFCPSEVEIWLS